jgi:hypothetical protein
MKTTREEDICGREREFLFISWLVYCSFYLVVVVKTRVGDRDG